MKYRRPAKLGDGENNSIYDQIHILDILKLPERYHYTAFFTLSVGASRSKPPPDKFDTNTYCDI